MQEDLAWQRVPACRVRLRSTSEPEIGIDGTGDLNIIDDVRFSKVQNMAHSRNLAAAIRSARVRYDYQLVFTQ